MAEAQDQPIDLTRGCPYRGLCQVWLERGRPDDECNRELPELVPIDPRQRVACHVRLAEAGVTGPAAERVSSTVPVSEESPT